MTHEHLTTGSRVADPGGAALVLDCRRSGVGRVLWNGRGWMRLEMDLGALHEVVVRERSFKGYD
ncbi:hypothetical protein E2C01_055627 [Portunus trituberculatus]|uniref:Uncharacterized protein n=1 Tax=Portunus trituberculatus TaxID=210409 RepID=A0A5B7GY74_PORTR|nr:hypothetical protein [Portunus trituberculatus]